MPDPSVRPRSLQGCLPDIERIDHTGTAQLHEPSLAPTSTCDAITCVQLQSFQPVPSFTIRLAREVRLRECCLGFLTTCYAGPAFTIPYAIPTISNAISTISDALRTISYARGGTTRAPSSTNRDTPAPPLPYPGTHTFARADACCAASPNKTPPPLPTLSSQNGPLSIR